MPKKDPAGHAAAGCCSPPSAEAGPGGSSEQRLTADPNKGHFWVLCRSNVIEKYNSSNQDDDPMMARTRFAAIFAATLSLGIAPAQSDDIDGTVGLGVGVVPDYEGSADYEPVPLPFARMDYREFFGELRPAMGALQLRGNAVPSTSFRAGPLIEYRRERDHVSNNRVDDLKKIDAAVELGAFAGYVLHNGVRKGTAAGINIQGAADVSGTYDGFLIQLGTDYTTPVNEDWQISARLSSTFADSNYMSTYFGIDRNNANRSGLNQFDADAGFKDVGLNLGADYSFAKNWSLGTSIGYTRLIGDAADSPITDDEGSANQFFGGVIINYKF
jgi:outer membrane scaffolding protein for murein synthesis (MipA/OmpV family)